MVLLVCLGAVLSFVGIYEPFAEFAGAGASVPLMGFGNILMKGVKEMVDQNGFIGMFNNILSTTSAGISSAIFFGFIFSIFFKVRD